MATAYSSEVAVGTYNRIRMRVEYSGTSATCYMEFRRTASYTGSWADSQASITFNGRTISAPYSYSGTVGTSWVQLCHASGFTVSTSGGTYNWTFNNPGGSSILGCSGSIVIGSQSSNPTGLSVSAPYNITPHGATFDVSLSSYGVPSSADGRWIEAGIAGQNQWVSPSLRSNIATNTKNASITVDNYSTKTKTLTIQPNTKYYYGGHAWNTEKGISGMFGNFVTTAEIPMVDSAVVGVTSATFNYSIYADGGFYDKTISYSIDGGETWFILETITGGSASSGTITLDPISPGTDYVLKIKSETTAGSSIYNYYFTTKRTALYGPVSDEATKTTKLYGSVNNQARVVNKLYGSVNGETKLIHQSFGHLDYS